MRHNVEVKGDKHKSADMFCMSRKGDGGHGYAKYAMDLMGTQRTCIIGGSARVLGGPAQLTQPVIRRCLARMGNWVTLLLASIRAEFPAFELLQAFRVFQLKPANKNGGRNRSHDESLHRLAIAFKVDVKQLGDQLHDCMPYASHVYRHACESGSDSSSVHCWSAALRRLHDRRLRDKHPVTALAPVLHRYIAWTGCNTSGVERGFSVLNSLLGDLRKELDVRSQIGELKLKTDMGDMTEAELVEKAQQIWREVFGSSRSAPIMRFRSGKQKMDHLAGLAY